MLHTLPWRVKPKSVAIHNHALAACQDGNWKYWSEMGAFIPLRTLKRFLNRFFKPPAAGMVIVGPLTHLIKTLNNRQKCVMR